MLLEPEKYNEQTISVEQKQIEELIKSIERAQKARDLLENEYFKEWMKESQETLFDILDTIPLNDVNARQRACDLIYLFRRFEKDIKESIVLGTEAKERWQQIVDADKKKGLLSSVLNVY